MVNKKRRILISAFIVLVLISSAEYFDIAAGNKQLDKNIEEQIKIINKFSFCGETIPFDKKKFSLKFKKELKHVARRGPDGARLLRNAQIILPAIEPILRQYKMPDDIKYLAVSESALSNKYTSNMGAVGMWQIVKETGLELGLEINDEVDERLHFGKSTKAACLLFKRNKNFFGTWTAAAVAYNMGSVALYKALRNQKNKSIHDLILNKETAGYIFRTLAYKEFIENCENYGQPKPNPSQRHFYHKLYITHSVSNLKEYALKNGINYELLKEYNPWIKGNRLTIKEGNKKIYELLVPSSALYSRLPFSIPKPATIDTIKQPKLDSLLDITENKLG